MMVNGQFSSRDFSLTLCNHPSYINGYHELLRQSRFHSTQALPAISLVILETVPNKHDRHFHAFVHQFYDEIQALFFPTFPKSALVPGSNEYI